MSRVRKTGQQPTNTMQFDNKCVDRIRYNKLFSVDNFFCSKLSICKYLIHRKRFSVHDFVFLRNAFVTDDIAIQKLKYMGGNYQNPIDHYHL